MVIMISMKMWPGYTNSINYMCLLRTWVEEGKSPGQANRNDVHIKQSCDKLPCYSQQCSDMDSVTLRATRWQTEGTALSTPMQTQPYRNTHHSENLKTYNKTEAYSHINCLI